MIASRSWPAVAVADPIIDSRAMVALSRLLTERDAALRERDAARAELARAKRALLSGGYTDLGGQDWKPPIGPTAAPLLDELDAARAAQADALMSAIERAMEVARG